MSAGRHAHMRKGAAIAAELFEDFQYELNDLPEGADRGATLMLLTQLLLAQCIAVSKANGRPPELMINKCVAEAHALDFERFGFLIVQSPPSGTVN